MNQRQSQFVLILKFVDFKAMPNSDSEYESADEAVNDPKSKEHQNGKISFELVGL